MSKRARADSDSDVDLDEAFQRKKQRTSATIVADQQNNMDDWFTSSRQSRAQRDGTNIKRFPNEETGEFEKRQEREHAKWEARRALDAGNFATAGRWQYIKDKNERRWIIQSIQSPSFNIIQRTNHLTLDEIVGGTFTTHEEDAQISWIYREYWIAGDKKAFLDTIYEYACKPNVLEGKFTNSVARTYAADNGTVPEKTLWKIFRCLVSELVPTDQTWDGIPPYIVHNPNTIWHVGKCMFNIITRGRFWDEESNTLNPVDNNEKFGQFKVRVLQKKYSRNLMKYVLGCLSANDEDRFIQQTLLDHFETVLSVYDGTYKPEPEDETADQPYEPENKNPLIPDGLTNAEGAVYERLIKIVENRQKQNSDIQMTPHIVTITDLAKDYDDLTAMLCLKELYRLGLVTLEGFIANLMPEDKRALFGRGALDSLGLEKVPIAVGTRGSVNPHEVLDYEFDGADTFMAPESELPKLPKGGDLLKTLFENAVKKNRKLTFLGISSLRDIDEFAKVNKRLLKDGLSNVVLQGGYRIINGILTADPAAANNGFDIGSAQRFHKFIQENKIPSSAWTKVAAFATSINTTVFEFMENTKHPLGPYLRKVQVGQDKNFYKRACSDHPFQPHMTQDWYLKNRSAWFSSGHEPDEKYPDEKEVVEYFINIVAYDAIAAVGASGEDVVKEFNLVRPLTSRPDAADRTHKIIGIPAVREDAKTDQRALPQDSNVNGEAMSLVVTALLKGALLSVQQGMKSELSDSERDSIMSGCFIRQKHS
jgi:hypothetical protein